MHKEGRTSLVRRALVAAALVVSAAATLACSSSDSSPGTEPICNTVVDDAPTVTPTATTDPAPAATGGTIAPGTYELSAFTLHLGPDELPTAEVPGTLSQVFEITADKIEQAGKVNDVLNHVTTTFTVSGTTLSTTDTCPARRSEDLEFTATDTEFRIYAVRTRGTFEQVYTRRAD